MELYNITASNNYQAKGYKKQIEERKELLPKRKKFLIIPDENNEGVGSGGATLTVIWQIIKLEQKLNDLRRILIIHSGGISKRVPQYSFLGNLLKYQ